MIYLTSSSSTQTFTFIPREFVITAVVNVRDEETDLVQSTTVPVSKLSNYAAITMNLSLVENRFYQLEVISGSSDWEDVDLAWNTAGINWEEAITRGGAEWELQTGQYQDVSTAWDNESIERDIAIYRDRIFCTDQTIAQGLDEYYDVNKGVYKVSTSADNTYKVYNA
jgi:hypothetical protein